MGCTTSIWVHIIKIKFLSSRGPAGRGDQSDVTFWFCHELRIEIQDICNWNVSVFHLDQKLIIQAHFTAKFWDTQWGDARTFYRKDFNIFQYAFHYFVVAQRRPELCRLSSGSLTFFSGWRARLQNKPGNQTWFWHVWGFKRTIEDTFKIQVKTS